MLCFQFFVAISTRAAATQCNGPAALGCFVDPYDSPLGSTRVLGHEILTNDKTLTHASCIAACCKAGFGVGSLSGLRDGHECYCDHGLGPYDIPEDSQACTARCSGNFSETCGGTNRTQVLSIRSCPNQQTQTQDRFFLDQPGPGLQKCGSGCTVCPSRDTCCIGRNPDAYRVPGGYGCAPPNSSHTPGCASGGVFEGGCCCGPGPAIVSATMPNVLIIGDSVSAGYTPFVRANFSTSANIQHGPDNSGGGNADGVGYGALCIDYFLRTPTHQLPEWDVVTFNFGLHDGADSDATYTHDLSLIADSILKAVRHRERPGTVIYFQTTIPGGSGSVPGSRSPSDKRVIELNSIAADIMSTRNITVVDLFETMTECGDKCKGCKPHCPPSGYEYLVSHAIAPAIRKALNSG